MKKALEFLHGYANALKCRSPTNSPKNSQKKAAFSSVIRIQSLSMLNKAGGKSGDTTPKELEKIKNYSTDTIESTVTSGFIISSSTSVSPPSKLHQKIIDTRPVHCSINSANSKRHSLKNSKSSYLLKSLEELAISPIHK